MINCNFINLSTLINSDDGGGKGRKITVEPAGSIFICIWLNYVDDFPIQQADNISVRERRLK
jgi:hypothetical protein